MKKEKYNSDKCQLQVQSILSHISRERVMHKLSTISVTVSHTGFFAISASLISQTPAELRTDSDRTVLPCSVLLFSVNLLKFPSLKSRLAGIF